MKKTILAIIIAIVTLATVYANEKENEFVPQYDSDTHYIQNFADWGEYESWCFINGIEPNYEEWQESYNLDGHCDFEEIERLGIDLEKETLLLFKDN